MARIPGVPTLDPVNLPQASPGEFGKSAEAVSQLGSVSNEVAETGLQFDLFLKKAQEHVDSLAAQNDLARVYADTQNQLSKTQNSRDVDGVIEQSNKSLNEVSARWSTSPASVQIQMSADALRPDLSRIGTVKQVDLMGKEFKVTINQQAEVLASTYAADRAGGGNGDMALGAFSTAVHGGVTTGLVGDIEANDMVRQFRQKGQELQIRNGITNANPDVNQKTYDDITQNRDQYPDVTQEQLDVMKGQALAAFEAHTKTQEWAEGEMARRTQLVPKIQQFTNPATGLFDEGAAMADNAERMSKGEITERQANVLAEGFSSHFAQVKVGYKKEADKRLDDIEKDLSAHNFAEASGKLEENKNWFEQHGFGDDYRAALRYTSQKKAEVRAEDSSERRDRRDDYMFARQMQQEQSSDQLGLVQHFITGGGILTKNDLYGMAGQGKGKMSTRDVDAAWKTMQAYETQPDFKSALDYIDSSFRLPTGKARLAPDAEAAQNRKYADTVELFNQEVNKNPSKSKLEIAHDIMKSTGEEQIKNAADRMFGKAEPPSRLSIGWALIKHSLGLDSNETPAALTEGATKVNSAGDHMVVKGGKWVPQQP